jgi:hypothetical protein
MTEENKKPLGMGHAYRIVSSISALEAEKEIARIKNIIDEQSTKTMPLFSLEFYINTKIDIALRASDDPKVSVERGLADWNDNAKHKTSLPEKIKNEEVIAVTSFNLSKYFDLYVNFKELSQSSLINDYVDAQIKKGSNIGDSFRFALSDLILKKGPFKKIYDDMKTKGIDVHISYTPDISAKDSSGAVYIYSPNIYQTDNKRMEFVKYLEDGGYIDRKQITEALGFSEHLLKHLDSHEFPNTKITREQLLAVESDSVSVTKP